MSGRCEFRDGNTCTLKQIFPQRDGGTSCVDVKLDSHKCPAARDRIAMRSGELLRTLEEEAQSTTKGLF